MKTTLINAITGAISDVELTTEEVAQRDSDAAVFAKSKADEEKAAADKAAAKAALLNKLGITADEAALLA